MIFFDLYLVKNLIVNNDQPHTSSRLSVQLQQTIRNRFSLHDDKADDTEIESRIRDGVELRGATPWILMFAIFVASVGLNVNSTAVIIGAMLISPLMGPIMGVGLGVAVYDYDLVKRSLSNLGIATVISLLVSALYFSLTPLQQTQSELLARTSPTIWDVLIALFGGLAGIVGMTRKEKSNVIPGVAIATALMPPVCTAGFGLATGQWHFMGGALYLYAINCVFISLATVVGIRALRLKRHGFADPKVEKRVKATLLILALVTAIPSGYLALDLVRQEVFRSKAQDFIQREFVFSQTQIISTKIDPNKRVIDISLLGEPIHTATLDQIKARLGGDDLEGSKILIHQVGDNKVDVTELKSSLLTNLLQESQEAIRQRNAELEQLKTELAARHAVLNQADDLVKEINQLYPEIIQVMLADGVNIASDGTKQKVVYLHLTSRDLLAVDASARLVEWLKVRLKTDNLLVNLNIENKEKPPQKNGKTNNKPTA